MAHFSLYKGKLTKSQVLAQKKWELNKLKPPDLIDPAAYLAECAMNPKYVKIGAFNDMGNDPGLVENDVEGGEVTEGEECVADFPWRCENPLMVAAGGRTSDKPCLAAPCSWEDGVAWRLVRNGEIGKATAARMAAQNVNGSGKPWSPDAMAALEDLQAAIDSSTEYIDGKLPTGEEISQCIDAARAAMLAGKVLMKFAEKPIPSPSPPKGGGAGMIFGIAAAAVVVTIAVVAISSKRSSRA